MRYSHSINNNNLPILTFFTIKRWKQYLLYGTCLCLLLVISACQEEEPDIGIRGKVLEKSIIASYDKDELVNVLNEQVSDFGLDIDLSSLPTLKPQYGIDIYRIKYETIDPKGLKTFTTGVMVVPKDVNKPLPIASYQHGTVMKRTNAPSYQSRELFIGMILSASGAYVSMMSDYLGLGDGPGIHPYLHAATEASACVDMLRAGKNILAEEGITLNDQLFLFGYSQGGHATMALHRVLEQGHRLEFTVTAAAPMAGPYDLSGTQLEIILETTPYPDPSYLPFFLYGYNNVYEIYPTLDSIFIDPYNKTLATMFDGEGLFDIGEVNKLMPNSQIPNEIIRPDVLNNFIVDKEHPLRRAMKENDVYDWVPIAPIKMYHCDGDKRVDFRNAEVAFESFQEKGVTNVELINTLPGGNHETCLLPTMLQAKAWFDSLKE